MRLAPLRGAVQHVMQKRIHARRAKIRIAVEIVPWIEQRMRLQLARRTVLQIMKQRVVWGRSDFRMPRRVESRVEQRMRIASFGAAGHDKVQQWADALGHVAVAAPVILGVEKALHVAVSKPGAPPFVVRPVPYRCIDCSHVWTKAIIRP